MTQQQVALLPKQVFEIVFELGAPDPGMQAYEFIIARNRRAQKPGEYQGPEAELWARPRILRAWSRNQTAALALAQSRFSNLDGFMLRVARNDSTKLRPLRLGDQTRLTCMAMSISTDTIGTLIVFDLILVTLLVVAAETLRIRLSAVPDQADLLTQQLQNAIRDTEKLRLSNAPIRTCHRRTRDQDRRARCRPGGGSAAPAGGEEPAADDRLYPRAADPIGPSALAGDGAAGRSGPGAAWLAPGRMGFRPPLHRLW